MNNRERILSILNHSTPDQVPWSGDIDYWYSAARRHGNLSEIYAGDGYFQLNCDLGISLSTVKIEPASQTE